MSTTLAVPLAAVTFAVWAVYLGGLASLQSDCNTDYTSMNGGTQMVGVQGITAGLPCSKAYRFYWFIMSWEFVTIALLFVAAVTGKLASMKTSFVGLFAVGTLLYIEASNTFLTAQSVPYYEDGQPEHRIRTITAGAIMTALMNAVVVLFMGMDDAAPAHKAEGKATPDAAV